MDPSQANSREYQKQAIEATIKSSEAHILELRRRRNALAPIYSLPTKIITTIFFFLRVPRSSTTYAKGKRPDRLAWLRVAHVCHQWREIALNQPLFWSHVDLVSVSSAGATEILDRAKTVPLHLEARVCLGHSTWNPARFSAFTKELQARSSHICYLGITAEYSHLQRTLEGLVSPAPNLESLSFRSEEASEIRAFVPDTLFDGNTPRLSRLELRNCDISWKSPLLKCLRYLEIRKLTANARPNLSVWLDALGEMQRLKTLTLYSASPTAPTGIERPITLPSLAYLDISASLRDCGLALAHLVLPALIHLGLTAEFCYGRSDVTVSASDVQDILPYLSQHSHGPQDTQPLQSVFIGSTTTNVTIFAWAVPDVDIELPDQLISFLDPMPSARVAFSVSNLDLSPRTHTDVFCAAMATLPLDNIVTLTTHKSSIFDEQFWLRSAPGWPLLRRVRLASSAARGFTKMLLEENGEPECPLLPSLIKLVLVNTGLSARRTLLLCDALMKRVEQGVPLETLDLRTCLATRRAVELLSEIVAEVVAPEETLKKLAEDVSKWESVPRGYFVPGRQ
ncbi:hypothetical protein V8E53_005111 [Lactarius tabidus]